jgi:hypothetical protein
MKKVFLIAAALLIAATCMTAQASLVVSGPRTNFSTNAIPPTAVSNSFISIFGNVPVREWKLRRKGEWKAHFINKGVAWEATFSPGGTLLKSEPAD